MSDSDCLFCKIRDQKIPASIIYRDDHVLAFNDITPRAPLHLLVIPLRHIDSLSEVGPQDADVLGRLLVVGAQLAADAGQKEAGYRVVMNAGPNAGQTVSHIHLHVLAGRALGWPPG
jgi:histidine triad (HIT) family protein